MAVDTRSKRASVLGVGLISALTLPLSDGSVDQADRQHVAFCYAGISASAAYTVPEGELTITSRIAIRTLAFSA